MARQSSSDNRNAKRRESARASGGGFRLGRVAGVELYVDWSLAVIFALVAISLGLGMLPQWHPQWSPALIWTISIIAAVLFFLSIFLHELSHALVARARGIPVNRITLFIFGGLAHMEQEPSSPRDEFLMAIAGPAMSLAIGVGATFAGVLIANRAIGEATDPLAAVRAIGPVATVLLWLGPINILLGLFNMVPGFPLDGGRVLRSLIWWATGNLRKATRWAAGMGQAVAWTLMAAGVAMAFGVRLPVLGSGLLPGLWLVLIGWFLNNAARMSYQQLLTRQALEDVQVSEVMRARVDTVPLELSIEELVHERIMQSDQRAFPVVDAGQLAGLVTLEDVRKTPRSEWPTTTVRQVMTPAERLATIAPEQQASDALSQLAQRDIDQLPVVDHGRIMGVVRRQDIMKWIALRSAHSH